MQGGNNSFYAGGFAGRISGITISGCSSTSPVNVEGSGIVYVGGFAGQVNDAVISGCSSINPVSGSGGVYAGGFAGQINSSEIKDCFSRSPLRAFNNGNEGSVYAGGFAGSIEAESTVYRCYAAGIVNSLSRGEFDLGSLHYTGGFVGMIKVPLLSKLKSLPVMHHAA